MSQATWSRWAVVVGVGVIAMSGAALAAVAQTGDAAEQMRAEAGQMADAVEQVRAREIAFAKTMADRDLEAFVSFLSPESIFFAGNQPLRGIDEIRAAWSPFFAGPTPPFSWHPDVVEVIDSGGLALSSGPVLSPDGEEGGRFNSVWRLDLDGEWRVIFDKGS